MDGRSGIVYTGKKAEREVAYVYLRARMDGDEWTDELDIRRGDVVIYLGSPIFSSCTQRPNLISKKMRRGAEGTNGLAGWLAGGRTDGWMVAKRHAFSLYFSFFFFLFPTFVLCF